MTVDTQLPKPRRHRWVTEAIEQGHATVSVWPSPDDLKSPKKRDRFLETIKKVGNDPRVVKVERQLHDVHGVIFLFHIQDD